MRLLVGLNHLELGGCQLNALDFAVAARDRGHHVTAFAAYRGTPGPLAEMVRSAGLPLLLFHQARPGQDHILTRRDLARYLSGTVARERIDLVHAYEPSLILDSFYGPHLSLGVPLVGTIYGNFVPWWLPRYVPLVAGARDIADKAAGHFSPPPTVIEPPVDTDANAPGAADGGEFRRTHDLGSDTVFVVVSRLEPSMKADGIELAINAVGALDDPGVRLVVVGEGPSFATHKASADRVNAALGRNAVIMAGPLVDPRPAYAAADITLGMGGSALRAMAFGKPLIVLGVRGFAKTLRPATAQEFLLRGFFGVGDGDLDPRPLASHMRELASQPGLRFELGAFGRQLIVDRFSLKAASAALEDVYARATARSYPRHRRLREAARVAVCKTGSEQLPESFKDRLRPVTQPLRMMGLSSAPSGATPG
jgi:glycosyltransferase involved in cell wall biosynthesis